MDLPQRWIIARQDEQTEWEFFVDRGTWSSKLAEAFLFFTLWGAEEARVHSAGDLGTVRNAAEVQEFVGIIARPQGAEAATQGKTDDMRLLRNRPTSGSRNDEGLQARQARVVLQ